MSRPTLDSMQQFLRRVAKEWVTRTQTIDYTRSSPNELAVAANNLASSLASILTVLNDVTEVTE